MPNERPPNVSKVGAKFTVKGCRVFSPTNANLSFLYHNCTQEGGGVDTVADPLFLRKSRRAGIQTHLSGSVATN
jgi:hypothetical protein